MRCYDTRTLHGEGRVLPTPFQLSLRTGEGSTDITCSHVLRNLPGKRLVCSGTRGDGEPVVAKIFLDPAAAERHYRRELQGIEALRTAGIPTPDLLFQGRLADGQSPVLLFREMRGFDNLAERLQQCDVDRRFDILRPVVEAIAGLHAAGLKQRDIHPGNFLLSGNRVMIIDGDDIDKPGPSPLPQQDSLANLALFFAQFQPAYDAIVPRLTAVYSTCRRWPPDAVTIEDFKSAIQRWRRWRLKRFLPKTQRSCTAFIAQKAWRRFLACDREWYSPTRQPLLDDPDAFIETGTILKAGNSATVAKISIDGREMVVKRYNIKNLSHALRRVLRPSRAMTSWINAHRLRFWGIPTPRPIAVIEERWGIFRKRAFFIMDYLPGETIENVLRNGTEDARVVSDIIDQLETILGQLAAARISHGDFKATNFLISSGKVQIVDLDGLRVHRRSSSFKRAYDRDLLRLQRNWQDCTDLHRHISSLVGRLRQALDLI